MGRKSPCAVTGSATGAVRRGLTGFEVLGFSSPLTFGKPFHGAATGVLSPMSQNSASPPIHS
jgi:hypothetical protein